MKIKKTILVLVCLLFILTPIQVSATNNQSIDTWKATAIISPEAGELKASGEIQIKFHRFMIDEMNVDHYDIYLDDQKVKEVDNLDQSVIVTSIYVTQTDYYQLRVVAVTEEKYEFSSSIRKFLIAKKGLNIDDKAVTVPVADMQESWYYNWSYTPSVNVMGNKEFVPMIWDENSVSWLESEEVNEYQTVLGFNEPDLANQANLSVEEAISYHYLFSDSGLRIGSAVTSYPTNEWYQNYAKNIKMTEIDFIPVHIYYDWAGEGMADAFLEAIDTLYEMYHKPIWVTEFGLSNVGLYGANSNYDEAQEQISQYLQDTINGLEAREYVERYTWFNFSVDDAGGGKTALYDQETGLLTPLGELYQSLGNPDVTDVDLNDEYVEDNNQIVDDSDNNDDQDNNDVEESIPPMNETENSNSHLDSQEQNLNNEEQPLPSSDEKEIVEPMTNDSHSVNNMKESSVNTGDTTNVIEFMVLMVLSSVCFQLIRKKRSLLGN